MAAWPLWDTITLALGLCPYPRAIYPVDPCDLSNVYNYMLPFIT